MWNGGYFGVIHGVKNALPEAESAEGKMVKNFVAGSIGGTFGTILNTPFDVVKTRIQNQIVTPGVAPKYGWTLPSLACIAREEGYLGDGSVLLLISF